MTAHSSSDSSTSLPGDKTRPAPRTKIVAGAVIVIVALLLYLERIPELLHWPMRVLFGLAALLLGYALYRAVRAVKFEAKKVVFSLILVAMLYGALHVMCMVFVKLMSAKDERLQTVQTTELSDNARQGIQAMLEGNSPVQFDREIGWVHRPGYKWSGHSITEQGLRGARIYPETAADPAKRFICVGDSFTFGYEVGDAECYPAYGEQLLPDSEWINLGICGGGLTQALLQYRRDGRKFGGKHVIIGFMTNNQKRTMNCFRAFIAPGGAMTPMTQPFVRITKGKLSIEPNPFQDISDYKRLLENEAVELARLRDLDYVTWSDQHGSTNPVLRTLHYIMEERDVDRNIAVLFNRELDDEDNLAPLDHSADPYGRSVWHPDSLAFKANTGLFDLFYDEVIADGRVPLIVIIPSAEDVEQRAEGRKPMHASLLAHLKDRGMRHFDFLDSLERHHPNELTKEKFFLDTHLNAETNKFLAEEIIRFLGLN
jgi:hypothetical protein